MTDTLAAFTAALAQRLHDHDRHAEGRASWPLSGTPKREAEYLARAAAVMDVLPGLMAEAADFAWPTTCTRPIWGEETDGPVARCRRTDAHDPGPSQCRYDHGDVSDRHDRTEAIQ